jgi:hypothetical protein
LVDRGERRDSMELSMDDLRALEDVAARADESAEALRAAIVE